MIVCNLKARDPDQDENVRQCMCTCTYRFVMQRRPLEGSCLQTKSISAFVLSVFMVWYQLVVLVVCAKFAIVLTGNCHMYTVTSGRNTQCTCQDPLKGGGCSWIFNRLEEPRRRFVSPSVL